MNQEELLKEISGIRNLMEKSSKFISISGISAVLIGLFALIGAAFAFIIVYGFNSNIYYRDHYVNEGHIIMKLAAVALSVLVLSLFTGIWMARRKAQKINQRIWNSSSKSLLFAVAVPLCTGGLLAGIFMMKEYYILISSTLLIFYGLALVAGSSFTFKEVKGLGLLEILLGLLALLFPGYGLWFWALGFGVLHIVYGFIVYYKYEK